MLDVYVSLANRWNDKWETHSSSPLVWDLDTPDYNLVSYIKSQPELPRLALDIGCGSGINAVWMAQQGISVTAIDISSKAIELAWRRAKEAGVSVDFQVVDFLKNSDVLPKFDLVFDRATAPFRNLDDRDQFAANVATRLLTNGKWVSLSLSNENGNHPTAYSPPRRSIHDLVSAIDPYLQFLSITSTTIDRRDDWKMPAWLSICQGRTHAVTRTIF